VGVGLHLCIDLAGLAVRGVRDRRLCTADRRLASQYQHEDRLRTGCPRASLVCPSAALLGWSDPSSDRGSQYVSIRYTERLAEAGIEPSVGSKGDSYDNALAETINGLYKAELIYRQSWKSREAVEMATLKWVHWYNHQRLLSSIGYIPPAEAEANFHQQQAGQAMAA